MGCCYFCEVVSFPLGELGVADGDLFQPTPDHNQIGLYFASYALVHRLDAFYELFLACLTPIVLPIILFHCLCFGLGRILFRLALQTTAIDLDRFYAIINV